MSMLRRVLDLRNHPIFVRTVGSLSCVVGLLCYALSSSFKSLFGEWNPTQIVLYIILSSIMVVVVSFETKSRISVVSTLKPHVEFLVLMLTSLYSFFADRSTKGKPDAWSVVSSGAFALTSLCLSLQIKPGFDVGLFSFFLGCVTVQLMKIHLIFILVAAGFCYPLVVLGSYSESQLEKFLRGLQERMRPLELGLLPLRRQQQQHQEQQPQRHQEQPLQSENGKSSAQELKEILIVEANRASFGMGQDKKTSENGDSSAEGIDDDDDDGNRASFGMGQDKEAGQISPRRRVRNVSPSPPPPPSMLSTQDDDNSFEKLPEVAATEQSLSDLQEREPRFKQLRGLIFEKLVKSVAARVAAASGAFQKKDHQT